MRRSTVWSRFATVVVILLAAAPAGAQRALETRLIPEPARADLRVDVPLVLVAVHVTTALGAPVTDLKQENFRLFEDAVEQQTASFAKDDAPVSIALLFDTSASMREKIRNASESVIAVLKSANAGDEFTLIEFASRPKLRVPFTTDIDEIRSSLAHAHPFGQTALLDAIRLALAQMRMARRDRKALVIVSDGGDNHSRTSEAELKEQLLESDAQVYAIGIFDASARRPRTREERDGPRLLNELCDQTGGRYFEIENLGQLPDVCARLGEDLRSEYILGYAPRNKERDGKFRRVRVTLNRGETTERLRVRYRLGYRAPLE